MKKTLLVFTLVSLFSGSAMAFDTLSCVIDTKKSPYTLELKFDQASENVEIKVLGKKDKKIVATYAAQRNPKTYSYEFGANNEYSVYVDEMSSEGIDESGSPFAYSVIFGDITSPEVTDSIHCLEL